MPGRHSSQDHPTNRISSGLSDLRALIRPKTNCAPTLCTKEAACASSAETKPDIDTDDQITLGQLIQLLGELEPRIHQYERTDSDTK